MSYKTAFSSHSKSLTEKKISKIKFAKIKNMSIKEDYNFYSQIHLNLFSITQNNLIKYSTSKKKYNIFIINSIIFDQRIHKVAVFKNNLLWDESSEFLKRFYKKRESIERIPKISEYYVKYTLFPPVYFGLEGLILIIMNKWTKRKRNYLEYIEDHEEEREAKKNKKKDISFEPLISPSLITNKTSSKSIISKNTLDLSKYENESNKNMIAKKNNNLNKNINNHNKAIYNSKDKKKENNSLSFSEIIDDLSSQYSIIINNDNNKNAQIKNKENDKKFKKNQNNINNNKYVKKEKRNEINVNKVRNTYYYSNTSNNSKINANKSSKKKVVDSPRKTIKISLNKKNNKFMLANNNTNIIKRNKNNFPLPLEMKKYQKRILNTENNSYKTQDFPNNAGPNPRYNKGAIKVNTITNYIMEKNRVISDNNLLEKKEENLSTKKLNSNLLKNSIQKHILTNKKKFSNNAIKNGCINSLEKNLINKNYNHNNILKQKNYFDNKRKSSTEINTIFNNLNNQKPLTYRNDANRHLYYLHEKQTGSNLTNKLALINSENKDNINLKDNKDIKTHDTESNNKQLYLEDPFVYKLTQLTKKKHISLTSANSYNKIKDDKKFSYYGIVDNNNNLISNFNYNANKGNYRKNLVLTKLNSKKNLIYNNKSKLLGEDIMRNNSSSLHKNSDNSINLNFPGKITNSHSFKPNKNDNTKNINLNLNLNIHFNIDMENKNKGKKILLNNTIINQLQNKINKNDKFANAIKNKDIIYQYPLTSRNSQRHLKQLSNTNKIEYTILKKY